MTLQDHIAALAPATPAGPPKREQPIAIYYSAETFRVWNADGNHVNTQQAQTDMAAKKKMRPTCAISIECTAASWARCRHSLSKTSRFHYPCC